MVKLRGLSALEAWTRRVTAGYKDVNVCDLSTSWRDGLAFCALIHHFRPDLIDFDCLSKHNVLYNNRLAFAIAEKHLNVSSLLDAEDMLKNEQIDRLSVATYLSQFYECFEGPSKSDHEKPSDSPLINRNSDTNTTAHETATTTTTTASNTTDTTNTISSVNRRKSVDNGNHNHALTHPPLPPKRDMRCQKCKLRVFILERIVVDDQIYHKSCHDNLDNNNDDNNNGDSGDLDNGVRVVGVNDASDRLNSDYNSITTQVNNNNINGCDSRDNSNAGEGTTGVLTTIKKTVSEQQHDTELVVDSSMSKMTVNQTDEENVEQSNSDDDKSQYKCRVDVKFDNETINRSENHNIIGDESSVHETESSLNNNNTATIIESPLINTVTNNNNNNNNNTEDDCSSDSSICRSSSSLDNIADKSPNSSIDNSLNTSTINDDKSLDTTDMSISSNKYYPTDKNPFGDDEDDNETGEVSEEKHKKLYPLDLNPFGEEDEAEEAKAVVRPSQPQVISNNNNNNNSGSKNNTPVPVPRRSMLNISDKSPSASLRLSPRKKRAAPTPPSVTRIASSTTTSSSNLVSNETLESRRDSVSSTVSSELPSSVPSSRVPTPLPRIKLQQSFDDLSNSSQTQASNNSLVADDSQTSIKSNDAESDNKNTFGYWKAKKRPAPPIPAVKRVIKGSIAEIEDELNSIGDQLPIIEKRSAELEKAILSRESSGDKLSLKSDDVLKQFLNIAREKCRLARRQKELMYMKREHKLEEIQADVEYKMRIVMSKQSAQKTEDDQKKEEELLQRLVEIIEERNDIVENMIRDENKEVEDYRALISKVVPTDQLNNYFHTKAASVNGVTKGGDKSGAKQQQHKKEKHKDKEKRKHRKESAVVVVANESDDSKTVSPKETDAKKEKHFTLGKSTLKKLGLKPSSDKSNSKKKT